MSYPGLVDENGRAVRHEGRAKERRGGGGVRKEGADAWRKV